MLKKFSKVFKNLDKLTYKIMYNGLKFCFAICVLSVLILLTYNLAFVSPFMFFNFGKIPLWIYIVKPPSNSTSPGNLVPVWAYRT